MMGWSEAQIEKDCNRQSLIIPRDELQYFIGLYHGSLHGKPEKIKLSELVLHEERLSVNHSMPDSQIIHDSDVYEPPIPLKNNNKQKKNNIDPQIESTSASKRFLNHNNEQQLSINHTKPDSQVIHDSHVYESPILLNNNNNKRERKSGPQIESTQASIKLVSYADSWVN